MKRPSYLQSVRERLTPSQRATLFTFAVNRNDLLEADKLVTTCKPGDGAAFVRRALRDPLVVSMVVVSTKLMGLHESPGEAGPLTEATP